MDQLTQSKTQYWMAEWLKIIQDQRTSGESIRIYCRNNAIKESRYYYWLNKIR